MSDQSKLDGQGAVEEATRLSDLVGQYQDFRAKRGLPPATLTPVGRMLFGLMAALPTASDLQQHKPRMKADD